VPSRSRSRSEVEGHPALQARPRVSMASSQASANCTTAF
jgi:hypothetical protein